MNCHKLMYKPYRKAPHYEDFLKKEKEKEQRKKKELFYQEIIKFRQSRYPLDFLKEISQRINPFELSLQKLKQVFSQRYPEFTAQMVNESVEHIFNRKCQESQMIKESAIVIEDGDQYIRNGRKLIKEDFSYDFSRFFQNDQLSKYQAGETSRSKLGSTPQRLKKTFQKSFTKMKEDDKGKPDQGNSTDRNLLTTDRLLSNRSRTDSPSKVLQLMKRTQRFNQILLNQIKKDKQRFENLDLIEEGAPQDTIFYNQNMAQINHNFFTDRSRQNESLNTFRQSDLLVKPDVLDTGRSQIQELNFLLSALNFQQGGQQTGRSRRSQNTLRINKQIKQQLYNAKGGLKIQLVRKAIQQLKKQNNIAANTSRITRNN